jgi:TonB family protein
MKFLAVSSSIRKLLITKKIQGWYWDPSTLPARGRDLALYRGNPKEESVFLQAKRFFITTGMLTILGLASVGFTTPSASAQGELSRKVKNKVAPTYPELARRMNISGTVKVLVVVAPNGELKDSKVVGGNPILVNAAMDALKKWKFEPAAEESTGTVEFKFQPQ